MTEQHHQPTRAAEARAVSIREGARLLGRNRATLAAWIAGGCPAIAAARRHDGQSWLIDLAAVLDWRSRGAVEKERERLEQRYAAELERLRRALEHAGDDPEPVSRSEALRRRAVADALIREAVAEERSGRSAPVDALRDFLASLFLGMRDRILAAPTKLAPLVAGESNPHTCYKLIDDELRETLEAIADSSADELLARTVEVGKREAKKK